MVKKRCLFLGCALLLGLTVPGQSALAQNRHGQEQTEVENLLREYYEACSEGDWERAGTLIAMENPYAEKTLGKWAKECGLERYDIIRTDAYHLETGDCWLVWVEYDMAVEDMEAAIPGATTYVLCKGKNGWEDCTGSESAALEDEVTQVAWTDEYMGRMVDVEGRYLEVLENHPELAEWADALADLLKRRRMEEAEQGEADPPERYIVQGGDCLWDIAEEKLGRGADWIILYEENRDVIGDDPNLILTGTELRITYQ